MPTYTWTRTREQVGAMVLRKLGVLGSGGVADPNDAAIVYEAMDGRLKELHKLGILWWNVSGAQTSVTLTGGTATATISPTDYLFPVSMMLTVGLEQQPITIISHREYQAIPDKATTGEPEQVFIDGVTCRFYPVPATSGTAKLTYQAIAADTAQSTAVDMPVDRIRAFAALVAGDLIDEFEQPAAKGQRLIAGQADAMKTLRALNQERVDSTPVTPEYF